MSEISLIARRSVAAIRHELPNRAWRAANALRNAELEVLTKQAGHGGRVYRVPGTTKYYKASAPGEVPALRTGTFMKSWRRKAISEGDVHKSVIESTYRVGNGKYVLGTLLEDGTSKMAPRPHHEKILKKAKPEIMRIYREDYF